MKTDEFDRVAFWTKQIRFDQEMIEEYKKCPDDIFAISQVEFWEDQLKKDTENLNYNGEYA